MTTVILASLCCQSQMRKSWLSSLRGLEDTFINARVTRYFFMMYSDERLMIGAADAKGRCVLRLF